MVLRQIQNDLFDAGADLSTPVVDNPEYPPLRVTQAYIDRLEAWCDEYNEPLPPLNSLSCPAVRRCRRCCTSRAPWRAGPNGRRGRRSRHTRTASTRCRRNISTGCRICCSFCRGWPIPRATCSGNPAAPQPTDNRELAFAIRISVHYAGGPAVTGATPART